VAKSCQRAEFGFKPHPVLPTLLVGRSFGNGLLNAGLTYALSPENFRVLEAEAALKAVLKRSAGLAFIAVLSMSVAGCQQPAPPPPPLPPLTQSCTFTNTPDVLVPEDQAVTGISVGRRGIEPSLVSVAVRVGDDFRQDGTMYVPGPDLGYHPYLINHPGYFARNRESNSAKHVTASMLWISAGSSYDRAPAFSMLCLDVDGATIAFYTARTLQPHTIVRFDFSPPIRPRRPPKPAAEVPAS
jgi:hypothetical protein